MDAAITATGLRVGRVLGPVSVRVAPGRCLAVLGGNGAGKSTLLAGLAGALGGPRPPAGTVWLPEGGGLDGAISVRQWLRLAPRLPGWDAVGEGLRAELALPAARLVRDLSAGQRVRLALVLTLGRAAPVYLLDDPTLALDPAAALVVERAIAERSEAAIVLATQDTALAERLATDVLLLAAGRPRFDGTLDALRARFRRVRLRPGDPPPGVVLSRSPVGQLEDVVVETEEAVGQAVPLAEVLAALGGAP